MSTFKVCALADIEPDSSKRIDVEGHRLAVVRLGDEVFVIGDRCSHADFSLAEGEIDVADKTIECWKHGSTFSLENGEPQCLPATRRVPTYEVSIDGGDILVTAEEAS